jgi:hypothetical protein
MPKSKVSDPITDQEIAFVRLVLSGAMTDRRAAESVGLNPDSAAYTKAKPRVRAYMLEHRAAVQQQLVQQDVDLSERAVEGLRRFTLDREQVLARLWQIANLSPEMTRGSVTGQVKSLSIIVAMENFIPDRRAVSAEKKSAPAPVNTQVYEAEWLRGQKAATHAATHTTTHATTNDLQPTPPPTQEEVQQEDSQGVPACSACPSVPWKPEPASVAVAEASPDPAPVSPPSPIVFPSRTACRLMSPNPLRFQTPECLSL